MVAGPWTLRGVAFLLAVAGILPGAEPLWGGAKMHVREGRPIVDGVFVNGQGPYRFLLDTGTNVNLIETRLARKLSMPATFTDVLESAGGKTAMPGSDGNVVELGEVRAEEQRFQYSDLDAIHSLWPDVRGVLGQWFLARFDYVLDLRGQRIQFGKQDVSGYRAEFRMLEGRSSVSTSLGDLVLDSGASRLVLFGVVASPGKMSDLLTVAGTKSVGMVATRLAIQGRDVWRGTAVAIPDRTEAGVAGLMPLSMFRSIYVCNSEGYVVFE